MNKKGITIFLILALIVIAILAVVGTKNLKKDDQTSSINNASEDQVDSNIKSSNDELDLKDKKVLIVYFTQTSNNEKVAEFIHQSVGGDLVKLETVQTYPSVYSELTEYAKNEQNSKARPELATKIDNIDKYDIVFLGYPIWWQDMPMPVYTFLETYDLSGKIIAPFTTHGGSGPSSTDEKIKKEQPNSTVTDIFAVSGSSSSNSKNDVNTWLKKIGF